MDPSLRFPHSSISEVTGFGHTNVTTSTIKAKSTTLHNFDTAKVLIESEKKKQNQNENYDDFTNAR